MPNILFKYDLSDQELAAVGREFKRRRKNPAAAWLLWLFTGLLGGHRFYLGDRTGGFLLLFTLGGFLGILFVVDGFTLNKRIVKANEMIEANIIVEVMNRRKLAKDPPKLTPAEVNWND